MSKAEAEPDVKSIEVAPGQTLHLRCDWGVGIGGGLWTTGEHLCAHFREHANARAWEKAASHVGGAGLETGSPRLPSLRTM